VLRSVKLGLHYESTGDRQYPTPKKKKMAQLSCLLLLYVVRRKLPGQKGMERVKERGRIHLCHLTMGQSPRAQKLPIINQRIFLDGL